ncbi:hypothetical protein [Rhodococcus sp. HNM0569]|uniref:hypothetical protein n=1 Tax=Rhodococcus sp. HNM0569 TaxID=2716340 RepID=UPI001469B13F|nr:hypothetical protein [Rhodococcus sp. HNM0569]NLU83685.1 hypothetical protein [Rhodococcus sp. HNM0569]
MHPIRRESALAGGLSDAEIRREYTRGRWRRLGHGAYLDEAVYRTLDVDGRHRAAIDAVLPAMSGEAVVSHQSAAVVFGLPLWGVPLGKVHVSRHRKGGGRVKRGLVVHCTALDGDVMSFGGVRVTTPARTVVDLACTVPFEQALVTADAAASRFGLSQAEFDPVPAAARGRRGVAAARRVAVHVDPASESVGESRSRALFASRGLPPPRTQWEIRDPDGAFVGRVDFLWESAGVVGEFDGRVEYGRLLRPGQVPGDVVFAEKVREDAIRDLGYRVVRWTWADLDEPEPFLTRLASALAGIRTRTVQPHP